MSFLDKLFKRKTTPVVEKKVPAELEHSKEINVKPGVLGNVTASKIDITVQNITNIQKRFIAFDVETTGLTPEVDKIIELGAVVFEDGVPVRQFNSLVNVGTHIPSSASKVNHITDDMLASAPKESEAYPAFLDFIGDALDGTTVLCAHNATFDMSFLVNSLRRLGYNGSVVFVDTLKLSRALIKGLPDYKQDTVATALGFQNAAAHRASSDAEVCGRIFAELLKLKDAELEQERLRLERCKPTTEELEICAVIQDILCRSGFDSNQIRFYRNSSGYVDTYSSLYSAFKFKLAKKGNYVITQRSFASQNGLKNEPCTASEGGEENIRVFFDDPTDLEKLSDFMAFAYKNSKRCADEYFRYNGTDEDSFLTSCTCILPESIPQLIADAKSRYDSRCLAAQEALKAAAEKENAKRQKEADRERKQLEKEAKRAQKAQEDADRAARRAAGEYVPARPGEKRAILQMDDDGNIIKEYESITEAVNETGINSKSIRDAAKGVQRHAGGFVWQYKNDGV